MRCLSILAVAAMLAAANPAATPARAQTNLSPESMEAARALFSVVRGDAHILPRVQAMNAETQDLFLKLLRERGLLN